MTGADLQWWHFAIALAIVVSAVLVFAAKAASEVAAQDRKVTDLMSAGLTVDEAESMLGDTP